MKCAVGIRHRGGEPAGRQYPVADRLEECRGLEQNLAWVRLSRIDDVDRQRKFLRNDAHGFQKIRIIRDDDADFVLLFAGIVQ